MRILSLLISALFLGQQPAPAPAQAPAAAPPPLVRPGAIERISPHVYVIPDFNVGAVPNVGVVIGDRATLVIDTGLGTRNGETVFREMQKVSRNSEIYVVATHYHSEHALGEAGFPATAKVIRARAQQADMDSGIAPNFSTRSPVHAELMKDAKYRKADELFDSEKTIDLGGVTVRMVNYGGTHTNGDTMIFVEGDRILFAGDVVMSRRYLSFNAPTASVKAWLSSLDKLQPLGALRIVPSHGELGAGSLIADNAAYLKAVQERAAQLKREGKTVDQAVEAITAELRTQHPDWTGNPMGAIRSAYSEAPGSR